jgi:CO dehydrogenase maturation factor
MKIGVSGKGGVGKTSITSLIAAVSAADGKTVLAVDADPAQNLGAGLGFPPEIYDKIVPIATEDDLINERTATNPAVPTGLFKYNPKVDDIPEKYWGEFGGVRLLLLGTIVSGGAGCACPANTFLKNLMFHLIVERNETVILDMEAGLEHLGRGTTGSMDALLIVVEPGQKSLQLAMRIDKLAADLGIKKVVFVGNKVQTPEDDMLIRRSVPADRLIGILGYDQGIRRSDMNGSAVYASASPATIQTIKDITRTLEV